MSETPAPLWLHAYSGKENGLMIVGTSSSLKGLGQQLLAAAESDSKSANTPWPPQVACPAIVGPYKNMPEFKLSFHLQGTSPLESILPIRRSGMPTLFVVAVAICAIVGVFTIVRWFV